MGWDSHRRQRQHGCPLFQSTHPVWDGTIAEVGGVAQVRNFNPPIPCGMGPSPTMPLALTEQFQSTHPVWDGTRYNPEADAKWAISIHPSRVGWDPAVHCRIMTCWNFNPPIPCGMGRQLSSAQRGLHDFNPPIPCGMGRMATSG